ncbi:MAG: D-glycero-beta-D-manno-heptose 1,7-bisphosphate 7-phosphatase [Chloroflexota bacterium]|nr:D-glycero-beta-D-manno-heptose 1,7-bisphosphate 7-phosphatase [Chloroflexota bacterium]
MPIFITALLRGVSVSTIFLDRDGVINENRADYVKSWQEFRFLPGSRETIAALTQAGHRIVICTNQAGIARGHISVETVEDIHRRMLAGITECGGAIEKIYYCPHGKDENCDCRKPRPGMLLRARDELGIDLNDAIFIGDSITDIRAGLAAGVRGVLVLTGLGWEQFCNHHHEANGTFRIMQNLNHASEYILRGLHSLNGVQTSFERSCYRMLEASRQSKLVLNV